MSAHPPYKPDPEWIEIFEENLSLRRKADAQERDIIARWNKKNPQSPDSTQPPHPEDTSVSQPLASTLSNNPTPMTNSALTASGTPDIQPSNPATAKAEAHDQQAVPAQSPAHAYTPGPEALPLDEPKTHQEIMDKNTNYVFIFGYTGSGKSTVLTAINMYMRQHYRVILNQKGNQQGIRLIHQMMRDVEHGQFPQPTSIGQITEYDTAFRMNGEDVNLTFLEMAGEDLRKVDVETGQEGFPETVQAYLSCPNISISFLIVADYDRVVSRQEDKLILQFLSYLYNEGIDLSRVGVILSKFDRGRTEMDVEEVIQTYLPQVDKWLSSGDIEQPRVFPFSIGDILSQPNQKDEISVIDLEDCGEVVPWLHEVLSLPGAQSYTPDSQAKGVVGKLRRMLKF